MKKHPMELRRGVDSSVPRVLVPHLHRDVEGSTSGTFQGIVIYKLPLTSYQKPHRESPHVGGRLNSAHRNISKRALPRGARMLLKGKSHLFRWDYTKWTCLASVP